MVEYAESFRSKMVRKMMPPNALTATALSLETGVSQATLSRWLSAARIVGVMNKPAKKWTAAEKMRAVVEAAALKDDELGAFLRREGLHEAQLKEWRAAAEGALDAPRANKKSPESKRVKELEREVRRKDRALAEASALLILKKKAELIWGVEDDFTTDESEL